MDSTSRIILWDVAHVSAIALQQKYHLVVKFAIAC